MAEQDLELKDVIRNLRKELVAAIEEGKEETIKFKLDSIDLELKVTVKQAEKTQAGFKAYIFSLVGSKETAIERVHTIRLRLTPKKRGGHNGTNEDVEMDDPVDGIPE
jgi:hypothetical protein